ncbi:MAG: hypothetical protein GY804_12185 [Alphaproteobacteria bacterium]|nr:hypothetical protein [Alphaproteobacteria bacterium]
MVKAFNVKAFVLVAFGLLCLIPEGAAFAAEASRGNGTATKVSHPYNIAPPERILRGGKILKWERLDAPTEGVTITDGMTEPVRLTTMRGFSRVMQIKSSLFVGYERSVSILKTIVYTTPPELRQYVFPLLASEQVPDEIRNIPIVKMYYKKLPTDVVPEVQDKIAKLRPEFYIYASPLLWSFNKDNDLENPGNSLDREDLVIEMLLYDKLPPEELRLSPDETPEVVVGSSAIDYRKYNNNPYNKPKANNQGGGSTTKTPGSKGVGLLGQDDVELFINVMDDIHNSLDKKYIASLYKVRSHYRGVLTGLASAINGAPASINDTPMKELLFRIKKVGAYYNLMQILNKHGVTADEWVAIGDKAIRVYRYEVMDPQTVNAIKGQKIAQHKAMLAMRKNPEEQKMLNDSTKGIADITNAHVDALFSLVNVSKEDWKTIGPYVEEFKKKVLKSGDDILGVTVLL